MSNKRRLTIEISVEYNVCEWSMTEAISDISNIAKKHFVDPDIQITDEVIGTSSHKMFCPHCDKIISGIIFKEK